MEQEPTKEEIERRAGELAARVMAKPAEPQQWPGRKKTKAGSSDPDAKPRKRGRPAAGS